MNGFSFMAASYRMAADQGKISKEYADKKIRIFDFLATCDQEDLCCIADSSALNDIMRGYCQIAIDSGSTDGIFDAYNAQAALNYKKGG